MPVSSSIVSATEPVARAFDAPALRSPRLKGLRAQNRTGQPVTYEELERILQRERRRELERDGLEGRGLLRTLHNTVQPLKLFQRANLLSPETIVGDELIRAHAFKRACLPLNALGLSEATIKRHITELNQRVRPLAVRLQHESIGRGKDFKGRLRALMSWSDIGPKTLSQKSGVPYMTIHSWLDLGKSPSTRGSLENVAKIEQVLGAAPGLLAEVCEVTRVSITPDRLKIALTKGAIARVRRFLPADFEFRDAEEQREIYEWVMANMIHAPRDEDEEPVDRSPYLCKLGDAPIKRHEGEAFRAPKALKDEVDDLIDFKTATFEPVGTRRETTWGSEESVLSQVTKLEMFFGALLRNGVPKSELRLSMFLEKEKIQTFIDFMEARRGFLTESVTFVLQGIDGHLNPEFGYLPQHEKHLNTTGIKDWQSACADARLFVRDRLARLETQTQVGRDVFEPIEVILDEQKPLHSYYRIVKEIRTEVKLAAANPLQRARNLRHLALLRYALKTSLRAKNIGQTKVLAKGKRKTPMSTLSRRKETELWFDEGRGNWVHRQPKSAFKNWDSPATADVEIVLTDTDGFYSEIEAYIEARPLLLNGVDDPGTLFVADLTQGAKKPTLTSGQVNKVWKTMIQNFGIYNPYTGRGAISGLRLHGPHAVRHIMATHIIKTTSNFGWAAAFLFDVENMVRRRYARFKPEQQFEGATRIIDADHPTAEAG